MNYMTQITGSPYQIQPGEAFSAYIRRMDDACGGSFLYRYTRRQREVIDFLGTVDSVALADALLSELDEDQMYDFCESPDFASQIEGLESDTDPEEDPAGYYQDMTRLGCDDPLTRANLLGLAENCAPGAMGRVATRLRGA